ncbi:MAG: hypothetical protein HQM08_30525 [Candidatus Riflebacteria bacterium]|nr:hypothetical protein [Candidatus Riflebacteria bacterium]
MSHSLLFSSGRKSIYSFIEENLGEDGNLDKDAGDTRWIASGKDGAYENFGEKEANYQKI